VAKHMGWQDQGTSGEQVEEENPLNPKKSWRSPGTPAPFPKAPTLKEEKLSLFNSFLSYVEHHFLPRIMPGQYYLNP